MLGGGETSACTGVTVISIILKCLHTFLLTSRQVAPYSTVTRKTPNRLVLLRSKRCPSLDDNVVSFEVTTEDDLE